MRGDFTLKDWLERHAEAERKRQDRGKILAVKKVQRSRDEGMAQQYFLKQKKNATRMLFKMSDGALREGIVKSILPYHLWLESFEGGDDAAREKVEKLHMLYCHKLENDADVQRAVQASEEVRALGLGPVRDKTERYTVPLDLIEQVANGQNAMRATLYDGTVFEGRIDWFSTYFVKLKVAPNASVVIFNHALHEVKAVVEPAH